MQDRKQHELGTHAARGTELWTQLPLHVLNEQMRARDDHVHTSHIDTCRTAEAALVRDQNAAAPTAPPKNPITATMLAHYATLCNEDLNTEADDIQSHNLNVEAAAWNR